MEDLVSLAIKETLYAESAMVGIILCCHESHLAAGKIPNLDEKIYINSVASTKLGTATPRVAINITV
jgi:hypothetical protein